MMINSLGSDGCSIFGVATGLMMMAVPIIAVAAVLYLIFARSKNLTS